MEALKKTVLIVDDEPAQRDMFALALEHGGFTVLQAPDGEAGLTLALNKKPDLLILDVKMPHMNGYEMLKQLRVKNEWARAVPVIYFTNFDPSDGGGLKTIEETNPAFFLIKSATKPHELVSKVKEVLA